MGGRPIFKESIGFFQGLQKQVRMMVQLRLIVIVGALCCLTGQASGNTDTLRNYNPSTGFIYFNDASVTMQAARFDLRSPAYVNRIVLCFGGPSDSGSAVVHLYGNEGGGAAPITETDLVAPLMVRKSRSGFERVVIDLPEPVYVDGNQFFVAVERVNSGMLLLSDRVPRGIACESPQAIFSSQLLRVHDGSWKWEQRGFAVEVEVEYNPPGDDPYFQDMTAESGIKDSLPEVKSLNCADFDRDGYLDILAGGRLYRNRANFRFDDVTDVGNLSTGSPVSAFIDADGDSYCDILSFGTTDSSRGRITLFTNNGAGRFERSEIEDIDSTLPVSFSIADPDGDGDLDLFLTEKSAKSSTGRLYVNDGQGNFQVGSELELPLIAAGSQWFKRADDGNLDLYVTGEDRNDAVVSTVGPGSLRLREVPALPGSIQSRPRQGGHLVDFNDDGVIDILQPVVEVPHPGVSVGRHVRSIDKGGDDSGSAQPTGFRYQDFASGGAWGDINNDGLLDVVVTTECSCINAEIYTQLTDRSFERKTVECGFQRIPAGSDAIWADLDNDGKVDMITAIGDRVALFRNRTPDGGSNSLQLDFNEREGIGADVVVHAGEAQYHRSVISGRANLVQDPLRLHFGLGNRSAIDSVVVTWPSGTRENYKGLEVNTIYRLEPGTSGNISDAELQARVLPNPFSKETSIEYQLEATYQVRIGIYTITGDIVRILIDEEQSSGGHRVGWDGSDADGRRVAQGAYIYRIEYGDSVADGIVNLTE